jgi:TatA/E family protein of Tat protein translocase
MNFLGMGAMEIIVIMVVALIIFGPDKLPEMGAQAGKALRDLRNATREMTGEFEESISDVRSAMDEMKSTVADVQRETRDLATSVTEITDSAVDEVRAGARTLNSETSEIATVVTSNPLTGSSSAPDSQQLPAETGVQQVASNGQSTATKTRTTTTKKKKSVAQKAAKPTKQDPLADLGGFDEVP